YSFRKDFSDPEIERGFQMAQALGVKYITASSNVSVASRVDPYAQKYKIAVGFHNHDDTANPDEFSTPETFARALKGASKYLAINLDIGHFTAANCDPVSFIREHHAPIVAVLRLLRDHQGKIPANIEYEYGPRPGLDTIAEMKKCYAYCREALLTNGARGPAPVKV